MRKIQEAVCHYDATLRQFIVDDKGTVAIVVFGLPPMFHEVCVRKKCMVQYPIRQTAGRNVTPITPAPSCFQPRCLARRRTPDISDLTVLVGARQPILVW